MKGAARFVLDRRTVVGILAVATIACTSAAQSDQAVVSPRTCEIVPVDLESRRVGGMSVDVPIASLRSDRVRVVSQGEEQLEGSRQPSWLLEFCGHQAIRHWNGLSWTDPAFKTADGLRVGETLEAFSRWAPGEPFESESVGVRYKRDGSTVIAEVPSRCYTRVDKQLRVDQSCRVTRLFLSLPTN